METLDSHADPNDPRFQANARHNRELAAQLGDRLAHVYEGGGERYQQRHREQGKLFVRDRIDRLLRQVADSFRNTGAGLDGAR